jgi:hypothetical protein
MRCRRTVVTAPKRAASLLAIAGLVMAASAAPAPAVATSKHAFQAMYLVPAHGQADTSAPAAIRNDIKRVDNWYARHTVGGVIPRWVLTSTGVPKVVTVTLPHTARQYANSTGQLAMITADLKALGWPKPKQKLVVYLDVKTTGSGGYCGITGSGVTAVSEAACGGIYPSTSDRWPYGATYLTAHEMTHNFGAVPACAPHSDGTGHVDDSPRDVLYNGPKPRDWDHLTLDAGHDDYYDTNASQCRDIIDSPYWTG